ncbi:hypothetical protein Btru_017787 [Bulinus truncatus]|nr:hypothetical protein Btru_017787 [Bulinus truncatus]
MSSLAKMRKSPPSILPQRVPGIHLKEVRTRDCAKRFFHAMDYFKLYFTLDKVTRISQYTNDYAKIHGPQKIPSRNIALKQVTLQSSNYSENNIVYDASKAVDGDTNANFSQNRCSHTQGGDKTPTWSVRFNSSEITRYILYNRNSFQARLDGFNLEAKGEGGEKLTYKDNTSTSLVYTVLDSLKHNVTNVTIIVKDKADLILTLCEVEIYGACDKGYYGVNCTQKCPNNCDECHATYGQCYRCQPGFWGENCIVCPVGQWGVNCNMTCSKNCEGNNCDKVNGHCNNDCLAGYQPPDCDKICIDGYWGTNCTYTCGNCKFKPCNKTTGYCQGDCNSGYVAPLCVEDCPTGHWGENCVHNCSNNCQNKSCDKVNGTCHGGCVAGFRPPKCDQVCIDGYWGTNCTYTCGNCKFKPCNKTTGYCKGDCNSGYVAPLCVEDCPTSQWGENCVHNCSNNCQNNYCDKVDGACHGGCIAGFKPPDCNQGCNSGNHGVNCSQNCSSRCDEFKCNSSTGFCFACIPGYHGEICNQVCPSGKYGKYCSETCSLYCNISKKCTPENGTCFNGCQDGYNGSICNTPCVGNNYGPKCQKTCSDGCVSNLSTVCHHISGFCLLGCKDGHSGELCVKDTESSVGAILGGILAAVAVIAVIAVGAILWKRKHRKSPKYVKEVDKNFIRLQRKNSFNEQEVNEPDVDSAYSNLPLITENTKIAVNSLDDYLKSHNIKTLAEHYRKIPKPKNVSLDVGQSEDNKQKNRYKNICPYDHSRVHLMINTEKHEGDYINASYIRDNRNDVKFIAAQGPYNTVLNDFVRMLWEQKTEKVVMLTNLIEEGKAKCEKYWPDSGKTMFGEIKVKLKETHHFADFIIRKIELEKKDESTRTLTHYHFTSWPDQGVPLTPWALVDFEQKVDASKATSPIVVHCSAGVGRTGTFIALHNIMRQAEETGYVDFYNTLAKLREDRTLMIQTADQYIFLHKAAQAAIVCIGTTVTSNDIRNRIKHLEDNGLNGISNMEKEFNNVCATCMDRETQSENADNIYQNTESITTETNSDERNRFPSITPRNSYRPYLNCETQEMESYINAVFVPGFQKKDQHLLTQLPMPTTFIDFWRLVTQYKVSLVVAFEVDNMKTDKTIANYLPSGNQPIISSALEIHSESIKEDSLWEEQTLKVTINNSVCKSGHHSLIHMKCKDTELNARKLLNLVNKFRSYNAQVDGRILYTCRDGASLSGLACVLSLLLDRMDHDSCLTVPLVVGSIKSIRPEVIPTFEQYKMLYEALNRYNETTATYSNMDESIFIKSTNSIKGPSPQPHTDDGNVYHNM